MSLTGTLASLSTSAARVDDDAEIRFEGEVEAIEAGQVTVSGRATTTWHGPCRRCLEEVSGPLEVVVSELFDPAAGADEDAYPLDGDHLELAPVLHDAVLLALPIAPLCDPGCAGPAPDAYPTGTDSRGVPGEGGVGGRSGHGGASGDPRWAVLDALLVGGDEPAGNHGQARHHTT